MSNKVFLLKREALAPGALCKVAAASTQVAVYNLAGRFYATNDVCTHAEASLAEGEIIEGDCVACPLHDGQYHIPTGKAVGLPCTVDVQTYRVFEEGDHIYADLDSPSEEAATAA